MCGGRTLKMENSVNDYQRRRSTMSTVYQELQGKDQENCKFYST